MNNNQVKALLLNLIYEKRITPIDLIHHFTSYPHNFHHKDVKNAIQQLIRQGDIEYIYSDGNSFLVESFMHPVQLSDRIIIKRLGSSYTKTSNQIVIDLMEGVSFGSGRHPTTRICLQAIDMALSDMEYFNWIHQNEKLLDIGTGSGILSIAAVKLGFPKALGLDIDPCALCEARQHVHMNGLDQCISIYHNDLVDINDQFALICANLRYPTLKKILPEIKRLARPNARVIVSGIQLEESKDWSQLISHDFDVIWQKELIPWMGMVLRPITPIAVKRDKIISKGIRYLE